MTIVEKSHKNENYYISLNIEKGTPFYYSVQVFPILGGLCGYPIKSLIYSINEKGKALATFRRYTKKYN